MSVVADDMKEGNSGALQVHAASTITHVTAVCLNTQTAAAAADTCTDSHEVMLHPYSGSSQSLQKLGKACVKSLPANVAIS